MRVLTRLPQPSGALGSQALELAGEIVVSGHVERREHGIPDYCVRKSLLACAPTQLPTQSLAEGPRPATLLPRPATTVFTLERHFVTFVVSSASWCLVPRYSVQGHMLRHMSRSHPALNCCLRCCYQRDRKAPTPHCTMYTAAVSPLEGDNISLRGKNTQYRSRSGRSSGPARTHVERHSCKAL